MEPPLGFVPLRAAADLVGCKVGGSSWRPLDEINADDIAFALNPEVDRVIRMLAERCEAGEIAAAYRSVVGGADSLERGVWRSACWRNYFATGAIDLDLPLLDDKGRPNANGYTARCTREVFVARQGLDRFVAALPPSPLANDNLRYPTDRPLIQEGLQALANGTVKKPYQAAKLVYRRAEGPSETANLDRLRKLIADELKVQTAKSSPKIAKTSPNT